MIRIRKHGTVIASFATPQEIVIDHANDSIRVGDGTDLMGPLEDVGGQLCFPVYLAGAAPGGLALDATLTDFTQKTMIGDGVDEVEVEDVGGEKALKVAVISTVGGGAAPAHTDDAGFTFGTHDVTVCGAVYDADGGDSVDDGDAGAIRMTADRILMAAVQSSALPTGASTSAKQDTIIGHLDGVEALLTTIDADTSNLAAIAASLDTLDSFDFATQTTLAAILADTAAMDTNIAAILADTANMDTNIAAILADTANMDTNIAAILADTAAIQTAVEILDNAIQGSEMQVDVVGALPAGTNAIGKLAANSGVDIGDVDVTSCANTTGNVAVGTAASGNPLTVAGEARVAALPTIVDQGDVVRVALDGYGRVLQGGFFTAGQTGYQTSTITNTTETTIVTADANNCLDIICMTLTNNSDVQSTCDIRDATAGTVRLSFVIPARGGIIFMPSMPRGGIIFMPSMPLHQTTKNNNWTVDQGTTGTATAISVYYGKRPT